MNLSKFFGAFTARSTNSRSEIPDAAKVNATQPSDPKKELLATLIIRVVEIIIDAVSSDIERAKGFLEKDPTTGQLFPNQPRLPTSWEDKADWETPAMINGQFMMAEPKSGHVVEDISSSLSQHTNQNELQAKGTFLFDFYKASHSNTDGFNIEIKPTNLGLNIIELSDGRTKQLKVLWAVNYKNQNNIYLKHRTISKPSTPAALAETSEIETTHLFTFYDNEVNPRNDGKTTLDVNKIFGHAHPSLGDKYLDGIPISLKLQIENLSPMLLRATYAATSQKLK